jgi:hypothetical protein
MARGVSSLGMTHHHRAVSVVSSVALLVLVAIAVLLPTAADAQMNVTGQWSTMSTLAPVQPIHVALLRTGKLLMIEGSSNDSTQTVYRYTVWNPATGAFSTGTTPWDLFCNSMSFFPDGRLLISGGNLGYNPYRGLRTTTIFDPATEKFIQVEDTAKGRWYPTTVLLNDGGVMSFSGLDENAAINPQAEIYDLGFGWSGPYTAPFEPKYYPRLHLLKTGKVLMTGADPATRTFDPATGTWSSAITSHPYPNSRMYGTSVMLPLKPSDGYAQRFFVTGGDTSTPFNGAHLLDTSASSWSWRALSSLDQARVTHNAVMLPNGKVLVVGGSSQFNVASTAAMNALLFDPATEMWGPAGKIAFPRMYHSTAILLPDATVWLGGSNPTEGVWTKQMEIYKPPYLFTSSGAAAARPSISSSPTVVGYGAAFSVGTTQAASISQVVLARAGSATHAFDMEQRLIQMQFTKGTSALTVTSPPNALIAPPGYYMLFILDANGVPSVARFIRLSTNPSNQPPVATITNPSTSTVSIAAGQSVTFAASASDPNGSISRYHWVFPGGSPARSFVQNPGAVTYTKPGTYTAALTVLDNLGENNVSPPTVTVVVGSSTALAANITSPANGATVSGTVTVSMSATNVQGSPASFVLKLDNTTTISSQSVAGSTATASWNTTTAANGTHTLNLTVTDGAGRTASKAINVTVSNGGTSATTVTITASDATATEAGPTTGAFRVARTGSTAAALTVEYTVAGTATPGTDYQRLSGSVIIPAGATFATVTVTPINDTLMEAPETVVATLAAGTGYAVGSPSSATVTIASDEVVQITATDPTATEAGLTTGTFTVTRTGPTTAALTVRYTVSGTATPNSDYRALSGSVIIPAGATSATIIVTPLNDTVMEGPETVVVALAAGTGYTVGTARTATVTIASDEVVKIVATDASATEAGRTTGTFTVSRTGSLTAALTVGYTVSGTATKGVDRQGLAGSVSIPAGATSATIVVTPIDDTLREGPETVIVTLTPNGAYTIGSPSSATVTIIDND